jgi:hypothetical protein
MFVISKTHVPILKVSVEFPTVVQGVCNQNIYIYTEWIMKDDRTIERCGDFGYGSENLDTRTLLPDKVLRSGERTQSSESKSRVTCCC